MPLREDGPAADPERAEAGGRPPEAIAAEIEANETNFAGFLALQRGMTGATVRHDERATWVANHHPFFWFNMATALRLDADAAPGFVQDLRGAHERLGTPVMVWVSPHVAPAGLAGELEATGVRYVGNTPAMTAELDAVTAPPLPTEASIERVVDESGLDAFLEALMNGYGLSGGPRSGGGPGPSGVRNLWREFYLRCGLGGDGPVQTFLARLEGRPASVATVFRSDGVAGVYCVATVADARRRGLGATVTKAALDDARGRGCRLGILQSSTQGFGVYRRMGFRHTFDYRIHRWAPAG